MNTAARQDSLEHKLVFEVKRRRPSVSQQEADVYCNGQLIVTFGDDPVLIKEGEKYYGDLCGGYASKTPDSKFILSTLYHPFDRIYRISEKIRAIISEWIQEEARR